LLRNFQPRILDTLGCRMKIDLFKHYVYMCDILWTQNRARAPTGDYIHADDNRERVTSRVLQPLSASCTHVRAYMRAALMISATKHVSLFLSHSPSVRVSVSLSWNEYATIRELRSPNHRSYWKLRHCCWQRHALDTRSRLSV